MPQLLNFETPSAFIPGQPLHVRLYGKAGCHLCQEAASLLNRFHDEFDFWVEKIDIEQDPAIRERLSEVIPVVTINGTNRVMTAITEEKLRRAFKKAMKLEERDHTPAAA
jgi:glutaredoxin